jgi:hypothetical protein
MQRTKSLRPNLYHNDIVTPPPPVIKAATQAPLAVPAKRSVTFAQPIATEHKVGAELLPSEATRTNATNVEKPKVEPPPPAYEYSLATMVNCLHSGGGGGYLQVSSAKFANYEKRMAPEEVVIVKQFFDSLRKLNATKNASKQKQPLAAVTDVKVLSSPPPPPPVAEPKAVAAATVEPPKTTNVSLSQDDRKRMAVADVHAPPDQATVTYPIGDPRKTSSVEANRRKALELLGRKKLEANAKKRQAEPQQQYDMSLGEGSGKAMKYDDAVSAEVKDEAKQASRVAAATEFTKPGYNELFTLNQAYAFADELSTMHNTRVRGWQQMPEEINLDPEYLLETFKDAEYPGWFPENHTPGMRPMFWQAAEYKDVISKKVVAKRVGWLLLILSPCLDEVLDLSRRAHPDKWKQHGDNLMTKAKDIITRWLQLIAGSISKIGGEIPLEEMNAWKMDWNSDKPTLKYGSTFIKMDARFSVMRTITAKSQVSSFDALMNTFAQDPFPAGITPLDIFALIPLINPTVMKCLRTYITLAYQLPTYKPLPPPSSANQ